MKKPLNNAPTTLQQVLLKLQRYNLVVTYKNGTAIVLADTLSCAYLSYVSVFVFSSNLESVNHTGLLADSEDHLKQIRHTS